VCFGDDICHTGDGWMGGLEAVGGWNLESRERSRALSKLKNTPTLPGMEEGDRIGM